jgi:hypothetical protein
MPPEAINKNMHGRGVVGPIDGFGQLWQKTYRLRVDKPGFSPEDVIGTLKQNFVSFQPTYNRFYPTAKGVQPSEVVAMDSSTPGGPVSTGVMVLYADDRSFTFITPQGHPESGWVSFSAFKMEDIIVAQILDSPALTTRFMKLLFELSAQRCRLEYGTMYSHLLRCTLAYQQK